ncbi:speckle-type POZ protein-like [Cotesia glomerata]|uniref:BTB domain-containing protein n=1 Tax=Cotesia glomerata TaxID=32391 RepID=A0AAV7IWX4_COTGL|nr:speckle-type POZ protein-like [Cotesia glomerata]KAH0558172.1 hypothetical protein KQX54_014729 [Cotesia glomerata]
MANKCQLVDLKELYNTKLNSDFTIIVKGKQFKIHKAILSAHSPVLATLFTNDTVERQTNEVSILDIYLTSEIFEKLLEYIYTDKVSNLDQVAANLFEAAHKYQMTSLLKICEESLRESLNPENIIQTLILADRCNAKNLKDFILDDMRRNYSLDILSSIGYDEISQTNLSLSYDVLVIIAEKLDSSIDWKNPMLRSFKLRR